MRAFPDRPVVGVGAVIVHEDRVVLVQRAHEPLRGEWSLPGGAVELGETLADALVREVREETGLDVLVGPLVDVVDRIHRSADGRVEYHFAVVDYLCSVADGRLARGSDASAVRWVSAAELNGCGLATETRAVIDKAMEMSRRSA
jgi:mutator protein MutT